MAKKKVDDIRPGDIVSVEHTVDCIEIRSDSITIRYTDGFTQQSLTGQEVDSTGKAKTPPPVPAIEAFIAPPVMTQNG